MHAFLEKTALIQDGNPIGGAQVFDDKADQCVPEEIGIPDGAVQEMLQAIRVAMSQVFGQLPAVLSTGPKRPCTEFLACWRTSLRGKSVSR